MMKRILYSICTAAALLSFCMCTAENNISERVGICRSEMSELFKEAGANYLELGISSCLVPHKSDSVWQEKLAVYKTSVLPFRCANGFFPGDYKLVGPDADLEKNLAYVEVAMQRGKELGIETFVLGSGKARFIPEGFSREEARKQFVELCSGIGDLGAKYGIVTVIEPLQSRETNFINSVREGLGIVKEVNKEYLQVLADFYHMTNEGEGPDAIIEAGEHLRHCHIAEKEERTAPGVKGEDFTPYLKALKKIGYQGRISLECRMENTLDAATPAFEELRRQIDLVF